MCQLEDEWVDRVVGAGGGGILLACKGVVCLAGWLSVDEFNSASSSIFIKVGVEGGGVWVDGWVVWSYVFCIHIRLHIIICCI